VIDAEAIPGAARSGFCLARLPSVSGWRAVLRIWRAVLKIGEPFVGPARAWGGGSTLGLMTLHDAPQHLNAIG